VLRGDHAGASQAFAEAETARDTWYAIIARTVRSELTAPFDPDGAEAAARAVLNWAKTTGDLWWRTWSERGLGIVARVRGDLETSKVILMAIQNLNPLERGRTLLALGETLIQLDDPRGAIDTLREASNLFEERGASYWKVRALVLLLRFSPPDGPAFSPKRRPRATTT
jgi:tetratricopeptide (TPR) repeat protein